MHAARETEVFRELPCSRIVAVAFFHSMGNHSHIHSDDLTPYRELRARLNSISRLCAFTYILPLYSLLYNFLSIINLKTNKLNKGNFDNVFAHLFT